MTKREEFLSQVREVERLIAQYEELREDLYHRIDEIDATEYNV